MILKENSFALGRSIGQNLSGLMNAGNFIFLLLDDGRKVLLDDGRFVILNPTI
jgi:hypothetical protein